MAGGDNGREPGRAQPVQRHTCNAVRKPSEESGHARHVAVVLAGLVGGTEVDVLDLLRTHTCATHRLRNYGGGEVVGANICQRPAVAPDRGPHAGQDDRTTHEASLASVTNLKEQAGLADELDAYGRLVHAGVLGAA